MMCWKWTAENRPGLDLLDLAENPRSWNGADACNLPCRQSTVHIAQFEPSFPPTRDTGRWIHSETGVQRSPIEQ